MVASVRRKSEAPPGCRSTEILSKIGLRSFFGSIFRHEVVGITHQHLDIRFAEVSGVLETANDGSDDAQACIRRE